MSRAQETQHFEQSVLPQARTDFARLSIHHTVGQALKSVQEGRVEGQVVYFYVVDDEGRLHGVVPARGLLLNSADTPVADIMIRRVVTLPSDATMLDACEMFMLHRLLALPIVDAQRRILGVIDVERYTDEMIDLADREVSNDVFQLIGVRLAQVRRAPLLAVFVRRFIWLLCNIAGGLACALLASRYEELLGRVIVLALFFPVVLALAESVSIQSLTLTLQSQHGSRVRLAALAKALLREIPVGVLLGLASGSVIAAVVAVWYQQAVVALCMGLAITLAVCTATALGMAVPIVLWTIRRDAKLASGPIVLAITDVLTMVYLLGLASWWLG